MKTHNLFVSHCWDYDDEYERFINLLANRAYFGFVDYSVTKEKPKPTSTDKELEEALYNQIRPTHIVIILAGMYVSHRKWIQKEIDIANAMKKPIIGIRPYGGQMIPSQVQSASKEIVSWNTESIVASIREQSLI